MARKPGVAPETPFKPDEKTVVLSAGFRLRDSGKAIGEWLHDIRCCHRMARRLFLRKLAQDYRYSSLGLIWAVAPMILTMLILAGGQRSRLEGHGLGVPVAFYGVFGIALAQSLLEALNATRIIYTGHLGLLKRQNVPIEGFIVASLMSVTFTMTVRLIILSSAFALLRVQPTVATLPFAIMGYAGIGLIGSGIGLFAAPLASLSKDVEHSFNLLPWGFFAITPIFIPASKGSLLGLISRANPFSWFFDGIRNAAYGGEGTIAWTVASFIIGFSVLLCGCFFCRIAKPHVLERSLA